MYDNNINSNTFGRLVVIGSDVNNNMILHIDKVADLFISSFNKIIDKLKINEDFIDIIEYDHKVIEICLKKNNISFALCHDDDMCEINIKFIDPSNIINDIELIIKKLS